MSDSYKRMIYDYAISKSDKLISCTTEPHIIDAYNTIFKVSPLNSMLHIKIFPSVDEVGILARGVYGLNGFCAKGGKLSLLFSNRADAIEFSGIAKNYPDKCRIRTISNSDQHFMPRFMTAGDLIFRFKNAQHSNMAILNFNGKKTARNLNTQFDVLFDRASPL